jgi:hypothetical protein
MRFQPDAPGLGGTPLTKVAKVSSYLQLNHTITLLSTFLEVFWITYRLALISHHGNAATPPFLIWKHADACA